VFKVAFAEGFGAPAEIRAELVLRLYEISSTIESIPAHRRSAWFSLGDSDVRVDVRGWQFFYRVDPQARLITVLRGSPAST